MKKVNNDYKNKYQVGQQVSFVYTNSVHKVVRAYGKIVDYKERFYYISVASDMPLMRVYCNKIKADYLTIDNPVKLPEQEKKDVKGVEQENHREPIVLRSNTQEMHIQDFYSAQLARIEKVLWWICFAISFIGVAILFK